MKKRLFLLVCFGFIYGQMIVAQNVELEKLQTEKKELDDKISTLQKRRTEVVKLIDEMTANTTGGTSGILTSVNSLGGALREAPSSTAKEIMSIPPNHEILVHQEHSGLYLKVTYKGKSGYLSYSSISSNSEIDAILSSDKKTTSTAVDNEKLKRLTKVYGAEVAGKICNGVIWEGMSQGMTIESIGRPIDTKKAATERGMREVWTYDKKELIFVNGELKKWTEE